MRAHMRPEHLAGQLAEMIERIGVAELERRTGIPGKSLYNYLRGSTSPPADRLLQIIDACGYRLVLEPIGEDPPATVEQRLDSIERQLEHWLAPEVEGENVSADFAREGFESVRPAALVQRLARLEALIEGVGAAEETAEQARETARVAERRAGKLEAEFEVLALELKKLRQRDEEA